MLRAELEDYLQKSGLWTSQDVLAVEKLAIEVRANELMLKKGGIKKSEARQLAIEMAEKRTEIFNLYAKRQQLDSSTIESHAENFRFETMAIRCILDANTGRPYVRNHDEYLERSGEEAVIAAVKVLANIVYKLEDNVRMHMFEMQWLKDAGYIDDSGRYVSNGKFVDRNGKPVDENGKYINEEGRMIDASGRLIDENGQLLIDSSRPFIDDETGQEVVICGIGAGHEKVTITEKEKGKRKNNKKK